MTDSQTVSWVKSGLLLFKRIIVWALFFWILFEVGFRVVRKFGWLGNDYGDVFSMETMHEGGYLIPNKDLLVKNGLGSKVRWINNSQGFRSSREFSQQKQPNTIRILSIGDSFTSGYRVDQQETFSFLLEKQLNLVQDSVNYEVLIANVSNPLTGLEFLNSYGLQYDPDIVLLGITLGNDLSECFIHLNGTGSKKLEGALVVENPSHDPESLMTLMQEKLPEYAYHSASEFQDYFDRLILPKVIKSLTNSTYSGESNFAIKGKVPPYVHDFTHGLALFLKRPPKTVTEMYQSLESTLKAYKLLSTKKGFDLKIGLFPQRYQVNTLDVKKTIHDYHLVEEEFDWQTPNHMIRNYCETYGLNCIDLLDSFQGQKEILYLPGGDMHWNAQGHRLAAETLFLNWF